MIVDDAYIGDRVWLGICRLLGTEGAEQVDADVGHSLGVYDWVLVPGEAGAD